MLRYRLCLPLVVSGVVAAVAVAAVQTPVPTPPSPNNPRPRALVPPRSTPAVPLTRFHTDMPIDMVRIVPEGRVLPGADATPTPRSGPSVDAPNARLRSYATG